MLRLRALIPAVELHCATQARKTDGDGLQPLAPSPAVYSGLVAAAERGREAEPGTITLVLLSAASETGLTRVEEMVWYFTLWAVRQSVARRSPPGSL